MRERSTLDAMTRVFNQGQEACVEIKMTDMLLMDVKWAFNHVNRNCLFRIMEGMGRDRDLMQ